MKRFLSTVVLALASAAFAIPAWADNNSLGATYKAVGDGMFTKDLTSADAAGVYVIGSAINKGLLDFDRGSAFVGTFYGCVLQNADADNSGAVDTAAGCEALATLNADIESTPFTTGKRYFVLDIDTAESGSNVSRLTIRGSNVAGASGGAPLVEYAALPSLDETSISHVTVTDCDDLTCASPGTGSTNVPFYYNGSAWVPFPGAAAGIANVVEDTSPALGGDLDGNGNDITGLALLKTKVLDGNTWYATAYASGSDTGGIVEAIAACDTGGGGRVFLPPGNTAINATALSSPIIDMPVADNYFANCELVGTGGFSPASGSTTLYGGSSITISNSASKTGIRVNGSNQILRGFTLQLLGTDASSIGIEVASVTSGTGCDGTCEKGERGVNNWVMDNVVLSGPAQGGPGIGLDLTFSLKGTIVGGEIQRWDYGVHYSASADNSPAVHSNNNAWVATKIRENDIGMYLDTPETVDDINFFGPTLEGNGYGLHVTSGFNGAGSGDAFLHDFGTHWENTTGNVYIQSSYFQYAANAAQYGTSASVTRDVANVRKQPDLLSGVRMTVGHNYTNGAEIRVQNGALNTVTSITAAGTLGDIGVHATDCPGTWGTRTQYQSKLFRGDMCYEVDAATLYVCSPAGATDGQCDGSADWVAVAGAGGDISTVGDCTTGACFEGAGAETTLKSIGNFLIDLDDDNSVGQNNHFYIRNGTNGAAFDFDEAGNGLALTSFYSPSIQGATDVHVGEDTTTTGTLHFYHSDGGTQTFVMPSGSAALAYTLPGAYGTSGYQLTSDGAGGLTWGAPGGTASGDPAMFFTNDITNTAGFSFEVGTGFIGSYTANASPTPSDVLIDVDFSLAYASLTTGAETCWFTSQGTGSGGFVCEGSTANTTEHYFTFPLTNSSGSAIDSGADTERVIVLENTQQTLTGKTIDAEGTGNVITTVEKVWFPASGCNNATPTPFYDLPTSSAAEAGCITGTNTQKGVLDFDQTVAESAQVTHLLPSDWTGAVDVKLKWLTTYTSSSVAWNVATACVADAETDDPAFNTASVVVDATKGTTNQTNDATITGLTVTGCAAGELLHLKVSRDPTNGSDATLADARLIGFELTYRRAI